MSSEPDHPSDSDPGHIGLRGSSPGAAVVQSSSCHRHALALGSTLFYRCEAALGVGWEVIVWDGEVVQDGVHLWIEVCSQEVVGSEQIQQFVLQGIELIARPHATGLDVVHTLRCVFE